MKEAVVTLLPVKDVARRTSLSKAQIYRMTAREQFPMPVRVSRGRTAWVDSEINEWIKTRVSERNAERGQSNGLDFSAHGDGAMRYRE
ncbi:helix-turn-helix transcriptional regulator [Hyphomicrobium facile]|uniref:Predicted DNA-binding transcriptional regulator AlpA n=1 Tax=Hyphomicrobium facile TaxID=51670 RepID=A0A1I7NHD4_9HYPH|nr:AlpA family phage regulatory protein [Hyphomicrobium facile]SFV34081.1 Predicted DNA-binding transcriptional regulator AlpA [Hyphomicrobium facile]